jgi:hypothetical protein
VTFAGESRKVFCCCGLAGRKYYVVKIPLRLVAPVASRTPAFGILGSTHASHELASSVRRFGVVPTGEETN